MFKAAIIFCIMGLLAFLMGVTGVGNFSIEAGKLLLALFLTFSVLSFIAAVTTDKSKDSAA